MLTLATMLEEAPRLGITFHIPVYERPKRLTVQSRSLRDYLIEEFKHCQPESDKTPLPLPDAANFNHLYQLRRQLQAGHFFAVRRPEVENNYKESAKLLGQPNPTGLTILEWSIGLSVHVNEMVFWPNHFPYRVPADTGHFLLWHEQDAQDKKKATFLASELTSYAVSAEDVIVFRNPVNRRSVPKLGHTHLFLRKNPNLALNLNDFPEIPGPQVAFRI